MRNPFIRKDLDTISQKTKYDYVKETKRDNFTFLNKTICKKNQTVLIGDSIIEIYNVTDLFFDYTKESGIAVYNRGISGDTSDRLLERFNDNALLIEPRNLVILIGTNDIGISDFSFTTGNVEKMLSLAKEKCPDANIILEAILPVNNHFRIQMVGDRNNKHIAMLNAKLKEVALKYEVTFADFTSVLSCENGEFKKEFTYDGLHPNAVGFNEISKNLIPLLK
ncbi:MAG: GDSL-type esterase/lipase family protein [Oscillospiraceae bacterium]